MHSVRIELAKLILVGTRITYAVLLFERSEFLIDTIPKKKICVFTCVFD